MRISVGIALGALLLATVATPASAMNCRQWNRLGPNQRTATIDRMIERAVTSNQARQYGTNLGAVRRCLQGFMRDIEYDFDDACSRGTTAGMRALENIFRSYIWSCVR